MDLCDLYFTARDSGAYRLHEKYAPNARACELVWNHSLIVAMIAEELSRGNVCANLDPAEVTVAALVHDLGVYRCLDWILKWKLNMSPYIQHGVIGAQMLREEGFSEHIARVAARHTGVGLTHDDIKRQNLPLPCQDWIPETRLEQLICYADKFHSQNLRFLTFQEIEFAQSKFGDTQVERLRKFRELFGVPNLASVRALYEPWQRAFGATAEL